VNLLKYDPKLNITVIEQIEKTLMCQYAFDILTLTITIKF